MIPGVPHATGVRTESGETIDAKVVVDAAGRRSPLSGMIQAAGGRQPPEHAFEAGFVYNTQYYLGASLPEQRDDLLSAVGSISVLTIPGDHGWWSVTLYHSPKDKLMRNVRDPKTFERVVRALPNHAHWADGAPQGNSFSMASTANTTREFVVDGVPCATGVVPVGDAWGFTNPSIGRGITLGLMHAVDLAPAIAEHMEDPRRLGAEWERRTDARAARWHASTVDFDRIRAPEVEAQLQGLPDPFDPADPSVAGPRAFASASHHDPEVLQWFFEVVGCFSLPDEVMARDGVFERVIDVALSTPPTPHRGRPGPNWRNSLSDPSQTRAVFVHGNPETPAIWGPLLAELQHPDVVTLSPPGFGAPVAEGFGATADEYVAWLASELEKQAGPVDLVGHDWGAGTSCASRWNGRTSSGRGRWTLPAASPRTTSGTIWPRCGRHRERARKRSPASHRFRSRTGRRCSRRSG